MALISQLKGIGQRLKTSTVNLYGAWPQRPSEVLGFVSTRVDLARQRGLRGLTFDTLRTAVNLAVVGEAIVCQAGKTPLPTATEKEMNRSYPLTKYLPGALVREIASYLPSINIPVRAEDVKNGYVCFQLPIDKANKKKAELTRALVAGTLKKYGYKGWSNKIDRGNDANAFYFVVENKEGEIVAATRMIRRIPGSRLPLEQGVKADGSSYSVEGLNERIADINSFYHKKGHGRALILLYAAMARYCVYTGVSKAFCMLDIENQKIKKLYFQAGFKYSERFDEKIYFPTFGRVGKKGLEPTGWTILEMNQTNILKFALLSLKYRFV